MKQNMVTISEKLFKVAEQFRWKVSNKSVSLSIDDTDIIVKRRICHHRIPAQVLGINPDLLSIKAGAALISSLEVFLAQSKSYI